MKKHVFILFVFTVAVVLISCEKISHKNKKCLVSGISVKQNNETENIFYTYDSQDRLTRTDLGSGWFSTWEYGTGRVTESNYTDGEHSSTVVYTLNSDGYAMSSVRTNAGEAEPESSTTYDYDEEGYLIGTVEISADDLDDMITEYYEYEDGNLIYKDREHELTGYYSETEYEYYLDKENKFSNSIDFLGKHNKNLVKKSTLTSDVMTVITNYSYQFNDDDYVSNEVMTVGTSVMEKEYTYDCE